MARESEAAAEGRELTRRDVLRRGGVGLGGSVAGAAGAGTGSAAPSDVPAVEWTRTYDHPTLARVDALVRSPGGGYAFTGGDGPAAAAAVDVDGTVQWMRAFEELPGDPTALVDDGDGVVLGLSTDDGPHLARVDPPCDVAWAVAFSEPAEGVPAAYVPREILPAPDGGYVVVGTHPLGAGDPVQWAARVDARGRAAWNELYATCGTFVGVVQAVESDAADYVVGAGFVDDCGGSPPVPALRGLTADGGVAWTTTYPATGPADDVADLTGFVRTADGGYALAGWLNDGTAVVWRAAPDRSLAWVRTYDGPPVTSLVATPDGGLAFAGSVTWFFTSVEATVTRLDAAGDVRWRRAYTVDGRPASVTSLVRNPDGSYVLGGAAVIRATEQGSPAYLTRTESESNG